MTFQDKERMLAVTRTTWTHFSARGERLDSEWIIGLSAYLEELADMRIDHVAEWIASNLSRFQASHANIERLRRDFDVAIVDLKANVRLCKVKCGSCHFSCLLPWGHDTEELAHDCQTDHLCKHFCDFGDEHIEEEKKCGYP